MSRCAECGTRAQSREYFRARRMWGGNYRSAAHHRQSPICDRCVRDAVDYHDRTTADGRRPGTYWGACRWDLARLVRLSQEIDG